MDVERKGEPSAGENVGGGVWRWAVEGRLAVRSVAVDEVHDHLAGIQKQFIFV